MMYDDDALDRVLFALPLEEPPADLRASILTATIYRPAPAFGLWECTAIGALVAVIVYLVAVVAMGGTPLFFHTVSAIAGTGARAFTNPATLAWTGVGIATALWVSFFTGFQPFAPAIQRGRRSGGR